MNNLTGPQIQLNQTWQNLFFQMFLFQCRTNRQQTQAKGYHRLRPRGSRGLSMLQEEENKDS
jgi:hypothetical protein